ncbi:OmpA family protein [Rhizobium sp.]|jgi:outer membrane protein OmpA-like peptidoglycan-associated protein|uniref:OmpA family protein n=1 Tax=Rhizobium sp. TaxID=391 RepID=UPI002AA69D68
MAGKIEITASVLIAIASLAAGQALAATNTSIATSNGEDIVSKTRAMSAGTMLDGHAVLQPAGVQGLQLAQAQTAPAEGQEDPALLLKKKHENEGKKPEPPKPHEEKPEPPKPHEEKPAPWPPEPPPQRAPEPPKAEPKHVEPPPPKPAPVAPQAEKPAPVKPAHEAAPPQEAPAAKPRPVEAEKPPAPPKPPVEKPAEAPAPKPPAPAKEQPPINKAAPQAPEPAPVAPNKGEAHPPKTEQAPASEAPVQGRPKPQETAPQGEAPAHPAGKPPVPGAANPPAAAPAPNAAPKLPQPPVGEQPVAPPKPVDPGKAAAPQPGAPAAPAGAPASLAPAKPNAPAAPASKSPAPQPNGQPPVPPPPAPGDAKAPVAIMPPLNTVQSRDGGQPPQGGQPGQGGKAGQGGQLGRAGQPGAPGQMQEAARPQFSPEQQQPLTPAELQRLKALAARPDQSNETIIMPINNGAPVLDSDKDANWRRGMSDDQLRRMRQQSEQNWNYAVPQSDMQAQREYFGNRQRPPIVIESIDGYQGRRLQHEPQFLYPEDVRAGREFDGDRRVMDYDGQIVVRGDDNRRFEQFGRPVVYEQVDHQRVRETVFKQNGDRIVSLRNRYGQLIQRSRVTADGQEIVLFYSPDLYAADDSRPVIYRDPGESLPPMRLRVPLNDYIIDVGSQPNRDYYDFIEQPPVEPVERVYTIDEVRNSARIRDKMRRIDLDTITFATGSWDISMNQAGTLKKVADAISKALRNNPAETFLIEGHTDAVGSAESNLVLSDRRAEAVANVLTQVYGIPPENMVTQGYGEQFLKVMTYGPEQQNRRVTIRRVTPLVRPVQQ